MCKGPPGVPRRTHWPQGGRALLCRQAGGARRDPQSVTDMLPRECFSLPSSDALFSYVDFKVEASDSTFKNIFDVVVFSF